MIQEWQKEVESLLTTTDLGQNDRIVAELLNIIPIPDYFISEWMPTHRIIKAIENLNLPILWRNRLLSRLVERGSIQDRVWVAQHQNTPTEILELLAGDISPQVRPIIKLNPNFTDDLLQKVKSDRDSATNWQTSPEILTNLAVSRLPWIRLGVAQNINTPSKILKQLITDREAVIKLAAIQNPMMPKECLKEFCKIKDKQIIDIIGNHPNVPTAFFEENTVGNFINNPNIPSSVIEKLAKNQGIESAIYTEHPNLSIRLISQAYKSDNLEIKQIIAKHPNTPIHRLRYLAKDNNHTVRLLVAENKNTPKVLREELLIDLAFEYIEGNSQIDYVALINNSEIPLLLREVLFIDVAIDNNWDEDLTIALNPFAKNKVRRKCWRTILADCDREFTNTIAQNKFTPPNILDRLADSYINEPYSDLVYSLIHNPNTPVETWQKLAQNPDREARRTMADSPNTPFLILLQLSTDNGQNFEEQYDSTNSKACPFYKTVLDNPNLSRLERYQIILNYQEDREPTSDEVIEEKLKCDLFLEKTNPNRSINRVKQQSQSQTDSLKSSLINYASSSIPFIRFTALLHPLLPENILIEASKSSSWIERYGLTLNPALPIVIKQSLARDNNKFVRASAQNNGLTDGETFTYQIAPIKPSTDNLFASLELIIEKLNSEDLGILDDGASYPSQALMWKVVDKGEFTFAKLTIDLGFIKPISADNFLDELKQEVIYNLAGTLIAENCSLLLNLIELELNDVVAYKITGKYKRDDSFKIIVGQTKNNNWIGISPLLKYSEHGYCEESLKQHESEFDTEDLQLKAEIDSFSTAIEFPLNPRSHQESEQTICEIAESHDLSIEKLLLKAKALNIRSFTEFYGEWIEEEGEEPQYNILNRFIATYLSDLRYYSMGIWLEANLYFIGKTDLGDYLVILTQTSFD